MVDDPRGPLPRVLQNKVRKTMWFHPDLLCGLVDGVFDGLMELLDRVNLALQQPMEAYSRHGESSSDRMLHRGMPRRHVMNMKGIGTRSTPKTLR